MSDNKAQSSKLNAFIVPILILLALVYGVYYFVPKVMTAYTSSNDLKAQTEQLETELTNDRNALETLKQQKETAAAKEADAEKNEKQFYKPVMAGLSTETIVTGEFSEILQLIRANKIKVRSIKYDYDPQDDHFVKNASSSYNVARLNMEMISEYSNYDNFLKELYKHDHFLDIESVEIVPYKKNKKILLINLKLKLYAKKS